MATRGMYSQQSLDLEGGTSNSGCSSMCVKYFCEGQATAKTLRDRFGDSKEEDPQDAGKASAPRSFADRHRKGIAMMIPIIIVHAFWWSYMVSSDSFDLFKGQAGANGIPRWYMSVTMVFGSMVAGATSEGGAAVAFPVMTLVFGIAPAVARDFSYMIQSVGMTSAAFTILYMKVLVEWKAVYYTTIGGVAGIIFGLEYIVLEPVRGVSQRRGAWPTLHPNCPPRKTLTSRPLRPP